MNQGLKIVSEVHSEIFAQMEWIRQQMVELTIIYSKKKLNNINKQFQDCIMNYFFEDFVGDIIKSDYPGLTKAQIKDILVVQINNPEVIKNVPFFSQQAKKYMLLPQMYLQEVHKQHKEKEYVQLLSDIVLHPIKFPKGELGWCSQIRKKCLSILLLIHFYNGTPVCSIFQMWNDAFPLKPLKISKSHKIISSIQTVNLCPNENISMTCQSIKSNKRKWSYLSISAPHPSKLKQLDHYLKRFCSQSDNQNEKVNKKILKYQNNINNMIKNKTDSENNEENYRSFLSQSSIPTKINNEIWIDEHPKQEEEEIDFTEYTYKPIDDLISSQYLKNVTALEKIGFLSREALPLHQLIECTNHYTPYHAVQYYGL